MGSKRHALLVLFSRPADEAQRLGEVKVINPRLGERERGRAEPCGLTSSSNTYMLLRRTKLFVAESPTPQQ